MLSSIELSTIYYIILLLSYEIFITVSFSLVYYILVGFIDYGLYTEFSKKSTSEKARLFILFESSYYFDSVICYYSSGFILYSNSTNLSLIYYIHATIS